MNIPAVMMMPMPRDKNAGFTLLELGLVLILLSLMTAGILAIATQNVRVAKRNELEAKLNAIEYAILSFRKANGYIPCPGNISLPDTDRNFGFNGINSVATSPTCTDGNDAVDGTPDIAATYVSGNAVIGLVPVRRLGLNDEYAYDPWGNRFYYAIDVRATSASTFSPSKLTDTSFGSITVTDGTNTLTSTALLVILSMGPNGHGAVQRIGTQRKNVGSTDAAELINCDCTSTAAYVPGFNASFVTKPATATFDDILRYYLRPQLFSGASDTMTEK